MSQKEYRRDGEVVLGGMCLADDFSIEGLSNWQISQIQKMQYVIYGQKQYHQRVIQSCEAPGSTKKVYVKFPLVETTIEVFDVEESKLKGKETDLKPGKYVVFNDKKNPVYANDINEADFLVGYLAETSRFAEGYKEEMKRKKGLLNGMKDTVKRKNPALNGG